MLIDWLLMNSTFSYSTTFVLNRQYYSECFEQSVVIEHALRRYAKALFFIVFGALLVLFTEVNEYAAWFVFALGILEAVSIRYQQAWWVARQMLSRAAKSEVKLIVDESGISTESFYQNNQHAWSDFSTITATDKGWLLAHEKGKNYISNQFLSTDAQSYLSNKQNEKRLEAVEE